MGDVLRFDAERLRILVERHHLHTGSARARQSARGLGRALRSFVKVMPRDYKRALLQARERAGGERPSPRNNRTSQRGVAKMGLPTGFLEIERKERPYEKVEARLKHWHEFVLPMPPAECRGRARAAWIAASRSVTTAVRSTT
jgi:hypothetical protein